MSFRKSAVTPILLVGLIALFIFGIYLFISRQAIRNIFLGDVSTEALDASDPFNSPLSFALAGAPGGYTAKFLAEHPGSPNEITNDQIDQYITSQSGPLYTPVAEADLTVTDERGNTAISVYLNSISVSGNPDYKTVTSAEIESAWQVRLDDPASPLFDQLIDKLESNYSILSAVSVPVEAVSVHAKLLGATSSLRDNLYLMDGLENDYIGALIGAHNVEQLAPVYADINRDLKQLEEKFQP